MADVAKLLATRAGIGEENQATGVLTYYSLDDIKLDWGAIAEIKRLRAALDAIEGQAVSNWRPKR